MNLKGEPKGLLGLTLTVEEGPAFWLSPKGIMMLRASDIPVDYWMSAVAKRDVNDQGEWLRAKLSPSNNKSGNGRDDAKASVPGCHLKLAPKQGEAFSYDLTVGSGTAVHMSVRFCMLVEQVQGDRVTLLTTFEDMRLQGKSLPAEVLEGVKNIRVREVMSSTNNLVSSSTEGLLPGESAPESSYAVSFPEGLVRIGDTWKATSTNSSKQLTADCKLVRINDVGSTRVAVIESSFAQDMGLSVALNGPATRLVDTANGMLLEANMRAKSGLGTALWCKVKRVPK
tara:strand:+ start:1290 stop:2141 length:852 start_codon:yes stop_codon:yes gene_type:complete